MARRFADEGARLTLIARGQEQLERAQDELAVRGAQVLVLPCDMREQAAATSAISQVIERFGGVDVLVNNLGILRAGPIENMTVSDFVDHLDVHFWGPLYACLAAIPHMKRRRSGRIVNVASIGGKIAVPLLIPYSASKFTLVGLSEGLAAELAKAGIRVTTVRPWLMRTGSHTAAEMKGRHELEYRWFALMASVPPLSINADKLANQIVEACRRGDRRLLLRPGTNRVRDQRAFSEAERSCHGGHEPHVAGTECAWRGEGGPRGNDGAGSLAADALIRSRCRAAQPASNIASSITKPRTAEPSSPAVRLWPPVWFRYRS